MSQQELLQPHQDPCPDAVSLIPILKNNNSVDNIDQLMGDLLDSSRIPSETNSQVIDTMVTTVAEAAEELQDVQAHDNQQAELPEATYEFIDLGSPIVSSNATSSWGELPSIIMSELMHEDANITQTYFEMLDDPENEM